MASILDRYGIKEVADVTFYEIKDGEPDKPVLYLDTLKVSTIEQTAEQVDARGGKGNPKLVTWDYGKEITVTIEDALFSAKSLSIMMGNGTVDYTEAEDVQRTVMVRATSSSALPEYFTADVPINGGSERKRVYMAAASVPTNYGNEYVSFTDSHFKNLVLTSEDGVTTQSIADPSAWAAATSIEAGKKYFLTYDVPAKKRIINVSSDKFPGTYYVTGDTYARSDVDGKDQFFQFIIPKAKLTAEQTITLEAEGDPTVFNMNLTVLRPEDGDMMKLVQYDLQ